MATTMSFGYSDGIVHRARTYKASKSIVAVTCAACIAATVALGFTWGGWVTSTAAAAMADRAVVGGEANLAADICVDRFITGRDAVAQTARLKSTETWARGDFMRQGGWLALPGRTNPVAGAADLCIQKILGITVSSD
jgi:hypothetical protein